MISDLSSVTSDLVKAVLDTSLLRHKVIANNIANHSNPEFVPQKIEFESILAAELSQAGALKDDARLTEALNFVQPTIQAREDNMLDNEPEQTLDLEMAQMAENTLRYEALIRGLSKLGDIKSMAVNGGRR